MTVIDGAPTRLEPGPSEDRFRLSRAGVLNVWQYDEQVFDCADGRLLLRGANGAGKSKTLEMLLPFALDGDKSRITASGKHHTSLLWLMTDGVDGGNRVGYVWVEFQRVAGDGTVQTYTCGVGIRASASASSATAWHFATDRRIAPDDLKLEDDAGPLTMPRLKEVLGEESVFEKSADYKAHVGRTLFGLDPAQYDEVLRLLYWLRQPQIGEDIEPVKFAQQLSQALPQLDEQAVRSAGDTFDELTAFGESIERRSAAAEALTVLADAYAGYARAIVAERSRAVVDALKRERTLRSSLTSASTTLDQVRADRETARQAEQQARTAGEADEARLRALQESPEFRNQRRLAELSAAAARDAAVTRDAAEREARQEGLVSRQESTVTRRRDEVHRDLAEHTHQVRDLDKRLRHGVPDSGSLASATPMATDLSDVDERDDLEAALEKSAGALGSASSAVTRREAAVGVMRQAVRDVEQAVSRQDQAEREASRAEERWERSRAARVSAEAAVADEATALTTALGDWASAPAAPAVDLPAEYDDAVVEALTALARDAAAPRIAQLHDSRARQRAVLERATTEIERLTRERTEVEAERDPGPPAPALARSERQDGRALWQVIDFAAGVDDQTAALIEAALQSAGLLDAWVRPGGRLLDAHHLDTVLTGADAAAGNGPTLADCLVPEIDDAALSDDDVRQVLTAVAFGDDRGDDAWIGTDGRWHLGVAQGRARKDRAQYIGAAARSQERAHRIALLTEAIAEHERAAETAEQQHSALEAAITDLQAWVVDVPSGQALAHARTLLDGRRDTELVDEADNRQAQEAAHTARHEAAQVRTVVEQLALEHGLPRESAGLDAIEQELRGLAEDLRDRDRTIPALRKTIADWADAMADLTEAAEALAHDREASAAAREAAATSQVEHDTLRESVGQSVEQLQRRIGQVEAALAEHQATVQDAVTRIGNLRHDEGNAEGAESAAQEALADQLHRRAHVLTSLTAVADIPGMLDAAGAEDAEVGVITGLAGRSESEAVSRAERAVLDRLAGLSSAEASTAGHPVWNAFQEAVSGPAGDHQPVRAEFGDLFAITARDDTGEAAIVALAARATAAVERDRELLTARERQQFEQHVLGELGDAIRQCRHDADELVVAMNQQLGDVTTSQGIRARLDWKLQDDVPAEVRAAVDLLAQPVGALIPEERAQLRDVLHHLIEASRTEHPELAYAEHLAAALDYRTWSEFSIRYTRPERPDHWERLHRRSPLSQGEQKVLCYLPLFAAAAAHFTSLAGAAPYAPRIILLDDAFPKIDVRTHPLLFGLLVQLDLDFVITSERLWGDHASMPSLAIYEALRDPSQRGIAQYEYRWDGRVLQSVG